MLPAFISVSETTCSVYMARDESIKEVGVTQQAEISAKLVFLLERTYIIPLTIPAGYQGLLVVSVQWQVLVWLQLVHDQIDLDIVRSGHFLSQQDPIFSLFQ
jgi:hypothetical protein